MYRSFIVSLVCILIVPFLFIGQLLAGEQPANAVVNVGSLELTPSPSNLVLVKSGTEVRLVSTLRFKIENKSSSDVEIILLKRTLTATDDYGEDLLVFHTNIGISGVGYSDGSDKSVFTSDKKRFVSLSAGQHVEVQISSVVAIRDPTDEFYRTHRPTSFVLSGTIAVCTIDNKNDLKPFSFSNVPLRVTAREK